MAFDPLRINKELFERWERLLAEFLDKRMHDPDFMKVVGDGLAAALDAKAALDRRFVEWCRVAGLPTRKDLEAVWGTVNSLETRVIDLESRVEALGRQVSSSIGGDAQALPGGARPRGRQRRGPSRPGASPRHRRPAPTR